MAYLRSLFFLLSVILIVLGCNTLDAEKVSEEPAAGSAAYYYELGLEAQDPHEKLQYYNSGLEAITDVRDTVLVALLEGKVYALNRLGENECSLVWIDSLISTAELQNDLFYQAKGHYRKSVVNRASNNREGQFENAFLSRQVSLKMGDTAYAGRRSLDMAYAQFSMGDFSGSQVTATEALKFLDKNRDSAYVSSAYNVVGLAYAELGFYKEAEKEYQNALSFAVDLKDSLSYLHNIALVLKNEGEYDAALEIFRKILASEEPDEDSKSRFWDNYAYTRWLQNPEIDIDSELLMVLQKRKQTKDAEGLMASFSHLTDYYFEKDKGLSREYARAYLESAKENKSPTTEVAALKKLLALSKGEEKEAYVDRYLFLNDSLIQANLKAKFHFAKVRFDEERKEQQISFLEAENLTQSIKTERLKTGNIISSLSALLFLLMAGTVYYYFSQRGKREKIKQIYLTEKRISKKIHDELANDVYNVMTALEPVGPAPVVDQLEKIYLRTRNFSRENSEIETGENFLKNLLNLLGSTTPAGTKLIVSGEDKVNWSKLETGRKIVLYRVLQEMMVNMKKHSGASLVALIFSSEKNQLRIKYSDNGRGVDKHELIVGNGIKNVEARLKTVGGNIIFETEGKGLRAEITIPAVHR